MTTRTPAGKIPPHGLNRYKNHRCRCETCTKANRDYQARHRKLKAYGRLTPRVDAGPVRDHIRALMAEGMSARRIAEKAETSTAVVDYAVRGRAPGRPARTVEEPIAARIMAVTPDLDVIYRGDATGLLRRVRALVAIGYPITHQEQRAGVARGTLDKLSRNEAATYWTRARVIALYDALAMTPWEPEDHVSRLLAKKARLYAARRGWAPPLAWDDDTIDDPAAEPAGTVRKDRRIQAVAA